MSEVKIVLIGYFLKKDSTDFQLHIKDDHENQNFAIIYNFVKMYEKK